MKIRAILRLDGKIETLISPVVFLAVYNSLIYRSGYSSNSSLGAFYIPFIVFLLIGNRKDGYSRSLPLTKRDRFTSFYILSILILTACGILSFITKDIELIIFGSILHMLSLVVSGFPQSLKKNRFISAYLVILVASVVGTVFFSLKISIWPMERYAVMLVMFSILTFVVTLINYHYYDKMGYRKHLSPAEQKKKDWYEF